ncbi:MAG: CoA-binding protein [Candidatus Krumholzibacteriota bacterium]
MDNSPIPDNPSDEGIREILGGMKRIAVVGISAKPERASHGIARFLVGQGFEVVGVNPVLKEDVLGIRIYSSLTEVPGSVDVVNVFRRSDTVPPVVDEAIAMKAGAVWMQEEVVHEEAAAKARAAGLDVVQDRCLYKEWLRLMNG